MRYELEFAIQYKGQPDTEPLMWRIWSAWEEGFYISNYKRKGKEVILIWKRKWKK